MHGQASVSGFFFHDALHDAAEFPPTPRPEIPWQGHRGIGASAPCLAAVPVVCDTTRLQLGSTTRLLLMAEPALGKQRAEPFGQRASARVHVHAHTLASQGGLRSLLRTTGNMSLVGARRQRGV